MIKRREFRFIEDLLSFINKNKKRKLISIIPIYAIKKESGLKDMTMILKVIGIYEYMMGGNKNG